MIPKTIIDIGEKINLKAQNVLNYRSNQVGDQIINIGKKINLEAHNVFKDSEVEDLVENTKIKKNKNKNGR